MKDVIKGTEKESTVKKTSGNTTKKNTVVRKKSVRKASIKKKTNETNKIQWKNYLNVIKKHKIKILAAVIVILILIFGVSSCGVNHKSPKSVVTSLIESYSEGKAKKAIKCFGDYNESTEDLKKEVDATIKYFKAHNAEKVEIEAYDILSENENYTYVYIIYNFVMEDEQIYPCISTYMVQNKNGKYYVVPPSEVTVEMSEQAVVDYEKFMTTDIYKKYTQEYETFTKKNPGYEEKIAGKVS